MKRINLGIWGFCLLLSLISIRTIAYAEMPETSYTDKIIGKDEVADLNRIESVRHIIEVVKKPSVEDPAIDFKVTQEIRAGIAEVDTVERTTRRGAKGFAPMGALTTVLWGMNVFIPHVYAQGWNPARGVQQSINRQLTNYKLVYQSERRPLPDGRKQDFKLPAQNVLMQLVAQGGFETFVFPYKTNQDGNVTVRLQPVVSLLAQEGALPSEGQPLKLQLGATGEDSSGVATIEVARSVFAQLLQRMKEEEQLTK